MAWRSTRRFRTSRKILISTQVPARVALASDEQPYRGTDSTGPVVGGLYADEMVGFVLAACGLRLQLSRSFGLPLLLRLLLLPALALEGVLALLFLGLGP